MYQYLSPSLLHYPYYLPLHGYCTLYQLHWPYSSPLLYYTVSAPLPPLYYTVKIFENVQVQSDQAGGLHSIQLRGQTQVHRGGTVSTFFQSFLHHTEFREDFFLSSIFKI